MLAKTRNLIPYRLNLAPVIHSNLRQFRRPHPRLFRRPQLPSAAIKGRGYDAVVLDHEHGPGDLLNAVSLLQAVAEVGPTPMMRVPWNDTVYIKRALDIGVMGIVVPYVQNAEEAQRAADAVRYPLVGNRGVAPHAGRCTRWGARLAEYRAGLPDSILLACQIETAEAIDNIDEIAAVENCEITIPTAITPNGDQVNDTWEVVDLDAVYPDNVVKIYNRWGNLIGHRCGRFPAAAKCRQRPSAGFSRQPAEAPSGQGGPRQAEIRQKGHKTQEAVTGRRLRSFNPRLLA
jgi:hypothetical protein